MVKNLAATVADTRDWGFIPGLGSSPAEGNGNPLQYSCQGNPMDRGAQRGPQWGHKESDMTEHLSVRQMKPRPKSSDRCPY